MIRRILGIFVVVMSLGAAAVQAGSASGVAVFPAGTTSVQALFAASQDLLKRTITQDVKGSVEEGKLKASVTYYDAVSTVSSDIAQSLLSWSLTFRTEADGRIVMTLDHTAQVRPQEYLPGFLRNVVIGAGASPSKVLFTFEGETKPLSEWKRRP